MPFLAPPDVRRRANKLRREWFQALQDALDDMADDIADDARRAMELIKRGRYSMRSVNAAVDFVLSRGDSHMRRYLAEQVKEAASAADRVETVYQAWEGQLPPDIVTGAEVAGAVRAGSVPTQASVALEKTSPLQGIKRVELPEDIPEKASELLPKRQARLSGRFHRLEDQRKIRAGVHRAIRESKRLEEAAKELIRDAPDLGSGQSLPKALRELRRAAKSLDEDLFRKAIERVQRYAQRIVDPATGTRALADARGGYAELLQNVRKMGPQGVDSALERWMGEKQRSNAERIVRTESAAAYRAREGEQITRSKRIVGLIWRLSVGARSRYVRRTKTRKSGKLRGSRCICEAMNGEAFPPSAASEWPRMGHPHCMCWWERVYGAQVQRAGIGD